MKKLIGLTAGVAGLLAVAVPAFAGNSCGGQCGGGMFDRFCRCPDINRVSVMNTSQATADTGDNSQSDYAYAEGGSKAEVEYKGGGARNMTTGDATANSVAAVLANNDAGDDSDGCGGCTRMRKDGQDQDRQTKNYARVDNYSGADAGTGGNWQDSLSDASGGSKAEVEYRCGGSTRNMTTGDATSRSRSWVVVNSDWR
jgi:hypothetical protein